MSAQLVYTSTIYILKLTLSTHRNRPVSEDVAYILDLTSERLTAFVPKFALESTVLLAPIAEALGGVISFDQERYRLTMRHKDSQELLFEVAVFQQVQVTIAVKEAISGHRQLEMTLNVASATPASGSQKASFSTTNIMPVDLDGGAEEGSAEMDVEGDEGEEPGDATLRKRYFDTTSSEASSVSQPQVTSTNKGGQANRRPSGSLYKHIQQQQQGDEGGGTGGGESSGNRAARKKLRKKST